MARVGDIERLISRAKFRALSLPLFLSLLDNLLTVSVRLSPRGQDALLTRTR